MKIVVHLSCSLSSYFLFPSPTGSCSGPLHKCGYLAIRFTLECVYAIAWLAASLNIKQHFPPSLPSVGGEVSFMSDVQSLNVNLHPQHNGLFQLLWSSGFVGMHQVIFFYF